MMSAVAPGVLRVDHEVAGGSVSNVIGATPSGPREIWAAACSREKNKAIQRRITPVSFGCGFIHILMRAQADYSHWLT